jgi:2,5-diamino-6-(ribosylamino)-4(3H)-pyrimidinone 5'-phosphate reductase
MEYDLPLEHQIALEPYLPSTRTDPSPSDLPFILLTYAQSLDARIAAAPGVRTALSGAASLALTHHLRARCDAILVGAGTAVADDPGLNCRLRSFAAEPGRARQQQPAKVVVDPRGRWGFAAGSKMLRLAAEEVRRAEDAPARPTVVLVVDAPQRVSEERRDLLSSVGGKALVVPRNSGSAGTGEDGRVPWADIFRALKSEGMESVMVEGGADVIRSLLAPAHRSLLDAVVVTVAPVWLGEGGMAVSPKGEDGDVVLRLNGVRWLTLGQDAVVCGYTKDES